MTFTVPIRLDAQGTDAVIRKVTTELERTERTGKAAGEIVSKALQSGKLSADQAAAATAAYAKELANAERAAERAAAAASRIQSGGLGSFMGELRDGVGSLTAFGANVSLVAGGVSGLVSGFASAAVSLADWHAGLAFVNDGLIQMRNRLRNVTQGYAELSASMDLTFAIANRTNTSWNTSIDVFARVANVTNGLGFTMERTGRFAETLQKLFASSGRSGAEASAAMLQFSQALGSGVLQGDEFRSISENMPALLDAFAARLGVTRGELKKLASEGKIATDVMIGGIEDMAAKADAAFNSMEKTFAQRMQPTLNAMQQDPHLINKAVSSPTQMWDLIGNSPTEFLEGMPAMGAAAETMGLALPTVKVSDFNKEIGKMTAAVGDLAVKLGGTVTPETKSWTDSLAMMVEKAKEATPAARGFYAMIDAAKSKIADAKVETYGLSDAFKDGAGSTLSFAKNLGTALFPALFDTWAKGVKPLSTGISELQKLFQTITDPARNFERDLRNLETLLSRKRITVQQYGDALADIQQKFAATGTSDWRAVNVESNAYADGLYRIIEQTKFLIELNKEFGASQTFAASAGTNGLGVAAGTGPNPLGANFLDPAKAANARNVKANNAEDVAMIRMQKRAEETAEIMRTAFGSVENALVKLATTGEFSFKGMVSSMMGDLAKLAANKLIMSLIGALTPTAGFSSALGTGATQSFAGMYGSGYAHGGSVTPRRAAHGDSWRIGGSSTVGDKVPFFAMVNSGETVDIRNRFQQGGEGGERAAPRDRVIIVENGRQLTAAQQEEEVIRIAMKAGFKRGR